MRIICKLHNNYGILIRIILIESKQSSETNEFDVRSPLEATALVNENIHGGSGYSAATVMDMGFEPTTGATPSSGKIRRKRATYNLSGSGTSGGGVSGGGVSGGALLTLTDLNSIHGQPPPGKKEKGSTSSISS